MDERLRVIGIGNPDRGDDGIGPAVATRVAEIAGPGVTAVVADPTDLMSRWEGADRVVIVDAVVDGSPPGTVRVFDAVEGPLPAVTAASGTHGLGVATVIELARSLDRLPDHLTVVGVSVGTVDGGATITDSVARAVPMAAGRALEVLEHA